MASITMKEMLDSGVHFGHQTQRWNPKMKPYVYGSRGGIHIIDLQKSVTRARRAAEFVKEVAENGGRMIFVGTKKQAVDPVQEAAKKCGQFYVTKRWLGGTLTNFVTIKQSIDRLKKIDRMKEKGEFDFFSKKERSRIQKEYSRLNEYLEGIRDMKEAPSAMFVVDLNKEHIAVAEAKRLDIPVVGIADTNVDPDIIDHPIPGNDDAIRSIKLFANMVSDAFIEGAEIWEQKLRTMTDKESDVEKELAEKKSVKPIRPAASGDGPAIVKVTKTRKLVAAGMADVVEIAQELEQQESEKEAAEETKDAAEETKETEESTKETSSSDGEPKKS